MKQYGTTRGHQILIWRAKDIVGLNWQQVAKLFDISTSRAQQVVYAERRKRGSVDEGANPVSREDG